MKRFYSTLIMILLTCIDLIAQSELPYNLNGSFISDSEGFTLIKTTRTYDSKEYLAETYHYFDMNGLNYKTVDFYNGEKQGFVKYNFNENGRLTGFKNYSHWVNTYESDNSRYWDSTLVSWENQYRYNTLGKLNFSSNQWFDTDQKPEYRHELIIEYNEKGQIIKMTEYNYDLTDSKYKIYFEPNSKKIASNQNISANSVDLHKYRYIGDTTIIENFRQSELKTIQKKVKKDSIEKNFLFDNTGRLVSTTTKAYNKRDDLIEEKCVGDCEISEFGEYSDAMTYDRIIYKYSSTGLLLKKTYFDTKYNTTMYIDYEYIK